MDNPLKEMKTSSLCKINPSTFFNLKNTGFVKKNPHLFSYKNNQLF